MNPPKGTWTDVSDANSNLKWQRLAYVSPEGRILASISNYNDGPIWYAWLNGAGIGEFMTKEAAMKQAEKMAS